MMAATMIVIVILLMIVMAQLTTLQVSDTGGIARPSTSRRGDQHLQVKERNMAKITMRRQVPSGIRGCKVPPELVAEIQGYQDIVDRIIHYVVRGDYKGQAYDTLAELVDTFGHRMTGSQQLEDAIDWMLALARTEGLDEVYTEDVSVPSWVRNNESLWMTRPRPRKMNMLGLGGSVGTPPEGIKAEVIVVKDFADLERQAKKAAGKIVVFNCGWESYFEAVQYRVHGASRAARVGAVGCLVRSLTTFSLSTPHTGLLLYDDSNNKIPSASITIEDAAMLERMQRRGQKVEVVLTMGALNSPPVVSRNSVAEVRGKKRPGQVVVVSGHLDSWDVGQGVLDDGGGSIISWLAGVVLQRLKLRPRRTLRAVLFTGEEQMLIGGQAYYSRHKSEKDKYQLLLESDTGTFTPRGLTFSGTREATCVIQEILNLMEPINASLVVRPMLGGPDITMWEKAGVPTGALHSPSDRYFWYHHSEGDTLYLLDPGDLDLCLAFWTSIAYVAADITHKLPHLTLPN